MTCGRCERTTRTSASVCSSRSPSAKQPSGSGGSGSPSGRPESTKPRNSCSTPRISRARDISSTRIWGRRSQTSGRSMAGLSTEPRSPPVQVATRTRAPSATYLAMVAAPLLDSSSGWACTASRRNGSASVTGPSSTGDEGCRRRQGPRSGDRGARHLSVRWRSASRRPGCGGTPTPADGVTLAVLNAAVPRTGGGHRHFRSTAVSTPTDEQDQGVWLTQEAHDRLKAELDQLVAGRPAMAAEINARREEGDLRENGGYHAAKDEQGKQEARIRQLTDLLRKARVGEAPKTATSAVTGTVITVRFAGDDDTEKFLLGSREIAGTTGLTVYSPESALGAAIMGSKPGATVTYQAPNGRDITVEVVGLEPFIP